MEVAWLQILEGLLVGEGSNLHGADLKGNKGLSGIYTQNECMIHT